jgi:hypothetical protein
LILGCESEFASRSMLPRSPSEAIGHADVKN